MTLCTQMYRDPSVLEEIRASVHDAIEPEPEPGTTHLKFDIKALEKIPLLLSLYAETLRFGVQIHIPRCSPHEDLHVGGKAIPQDKLVLVNTWVAHTDEEVWNTRDGEFPLDRFWARRFLVDPDDDRSGPVKRQQRHETTSSIIAGTKTDSRGRVEFSIDGLDGVWIPYGGT